MRPRQYCDCLGKYRGWAHERKLVAKNRAKDGQLKLAKEQLAEIKNRCGEKCAEYKQLATVIKTGKSKTW